MIMINKIWHMAEGCGVGTETWNPRKFGSGIELRMFPPST